MHSARIVRAARQGPRLRPCTGLCVLPTQYMHARSLGTAQQLQQSVAASGPHSGNDAALLASKVEGQLGNKISLMFTVNDGPGSLSKILELFQKYEVNLSRIESRPQKRSRKFEFTVDFEGQPNQSNVSALLNDLKTVTSNSASLVAPKLVPWFPTSIREIDQFSTKTLDAGAELEADHPGFQDVEYRERRRRIVEAASTYKHGEQIPRVSYTDKEVETWGLVYDKLRAYTRRFGTESYNRVFPLLEANCGYAANNIPQLQDISVFLKDCTGFTLRPVGGLLSARDFLNGLAFRVFFSTQYIRHHSVPLYTPEPDICHELLGHAPMFADPDFADFSQEIGLASLGASDADIRKLATCYWFSVEFGLCRELKADGAKEQGVGELKAYGAGLLSSFGELEYACAPYRPAGDTNDMPLYLPWEPSKAAVQDYPITKYQPLYYVADSLADAKARMRDYCETLPRPFHVSYDPFSETVSVDRAVVRGQYQATLQK